LSNIIYYQKWRKNGGNFDSRIPVFYSPKEKNMKYVLPFAALALVSTPVAALEVSGSAGVTSNYVWRGATQSMGEPVAQGNIGVEHNGFYADVWASQVNFDGEKDYEVNYSAGFSSNLGEHVSYDVGYLKYSYMDDDVDFVDDVGEVYGSVSVGPLSGTVFRDIEPKTSFYQGSVAFGEMVGLPLDVEGFVGRGEDEEFSYGGSVGKSWKNFTVSYTYTTKETEIEDSAHAVSLFYNF